MTGMEPMMIAAAAQAAKGIAENRMQAKAIKSERNQATARLKAGREMAERKRKEKLKRTSASARAQFAASGVSASGGSAGAVIRGFEKSSALESADGEKADGLTLGEINNRYGMAKKRNLLDLADTGNQAFMGYLRSK